MTNPAIILKDGTEIQKGSWMHLWRRYVLFMILKIKNSRTQSVYIVK